MKWVAKIFLFPFAQAKLEKVGWTGTAAGGGLARLSKLNLYFKFWRIVQHSVLIYGLQTLEELLLSRVYTARWNPLFCCRALSTHWWVPLHLSRFCFRLLSLFTLTLSANQVSHTHLRCQGDHKKRIETLYKEKSPLLSLHLFTASPYSQVKAGPFTLSRWNSFRKELRKF